MTTSRPSTSSLASCAKGINLPNSLISHANTASARKKNPLRSRFLSGFAAELCAAFVVADKELPVGPAAAIAPPPLKPLRILRVERGSVGAPLRVPGAGNTLRMSQVQYVPVGRLSQTIKPNGRQASNTFATTSDPARRSAADHGS